jgi:hypothetical protein
MKYREAKSARPEQIAAYTAAIISGCSRLSVGISCICGRRNTDIGLSGCSMPCGAPIRREKSFRDRADHNNRESLGLRKCNRLTISEAKIAAGKAG